MDGMGEKIKHLFCQTNADSISSSFHQFTLIENRRGYHCLFHSLFNILLILFFILSLLIFQPPKEHLLSVSATHMNEMERIVINLWSTLKQIKGLINQIKCKTWEWNGDRKTHSQTTEIERMIKYGRTMGCTFLRWK